jgi:glycosyltransferase involved in cell wall biosynthesis
LSAGTLFSVVTVCRNARAALEVTAASVLTQVSPDVEYLVVDGASTDETPTTLERLSAQGVRVISEPDLGIADAMNKGVRLARGTWVTHLHAGDAWLPDTLAVVRREVERANADVLCGWLVKDEDTGETLYRADPSRLDREMTLNHPAAFVRRDCFERFGGFDPAYPNAMDYEYFLRLKRAGARIQVIERPLARMAGGGQSERSLWRTASECRAIRRRHGSSAWHSSQVYFLWTVARGVARRALQRLGLGTAVAWYRRHLSWPPKG